MARVVLTEFQTSGPLPIDRSEIPILQRRLQGLVDVLLDLEGVKIRAQSHVGYIPINDTVEVIVTPKFAEFEDFFYLLERSGMVPKMSRDTDIFAGLEPSERLHPPQFLISLLVQFLRRLRRDGMSRQSRLVSMRRESVKGKIAVADTIRKYLVRGLPYCLQCNFFDWSADTIENRFIKQTVRRLLATKGLPKPHMKELRDIWRWLDAIPFDTTGRYGRDIALQIRRRRFPVGRAYYVDLLSLCLLIMDNSTVVVRAADDVRVCAFTIRMEDLFERYVRAVLAEALYPMYAVLNGNSSPRPLFSNSANPEITPDIVVSVGSDCRLVGDAKYKDKEMPSVDDWYQAISYSLALNTATSMLIYASTDARPPQEFTISDRKLWVAYMPIKNPKQHEHALIQFVRDRLS